MFNVTSEAYLWNYLQTKFTFLAAEIHQLST